MPGPRRSTSTRPMINIGCGRALEPTMPDTAIGYRSEIVEIFERHGFIWGGKWSYYDTMHFEYRPELLSGPAALDRSPNAVELHRVGAEHDRRR